MTWAYRIVHDQEHDWYTICEVYYDNSDEINGYTSEARPGGETVGELRRDLHMMMAAFDYPVLRLEDLMDKAIER